MKNLITILTLLISIHINSNENKIISASYDDQSNSISVNFINFKTNISEVSKTDIILITSKRIKECKIVCFVKLQRDKINVEDFYIINLISSKNKKLASISILKENKNIPLNAITTIDTGLIKENTFGIILNLDQEYILKNTSINY